MIRKRLRKENFDYSREGSYFITICVHNFRELLSKIIDGNVNLLAAGEIVRNNIESIPNKFQGFELGSYVIMPDHVHLIISRSGGINPARTYHDPNHADENSQRNISIPDVIKWIKGKSSFEINKSDKKINFKWHRSFHDHIIRDAEEYTKIRNYIVNNPINWHLNKNP